MMRRQLPAMTVIAVLALAASGALAQFPIPRPPRVPDVGDIVRDLGIRIPDLRRILSEEPAISSSFDDAVYGVPFLDDLDPGITAPMSQLPFTGDGAFIVALPGVYELDACSFCLHAGTYGPGSGEGYLYAPLRGALAGPIRSVLRGAMVHPEIEQHRVQSLIWAIESRAKVSEMSRELQEAARVLLTRDQINRLNGGALGMVPEELFDQAFVGVPDEVRMVLEAQARLRQLLQRELYDFEALEQIAVLAGDPEPQEGGPEVPLGRWSWTPDGFFVRYFPNGYSQTRVQLYAPEPFTVATDAMGRISAITNRYGATIAVSYADGGPVAVMGDVHCYALAVLRLVAPDGEAIELACSDDDLVLTGLPGGNAAPDGEVGALYRVAAETMQQVRELAEHVPDASSDAQRLTALANLAQFTDAFERVAAHTDEPKRLRHWLNMSRMACASELTVLLGSEPVGSGLAAAAPPMLDGLRLALLPSPTSWQAPLGNPGGMRAFDPSAGGAMPANRGRQRLGTSGRSRELPKFEWRPPRDRNEDDGEDDGDEDDDDPSGEDSKGAASRARGAIDGIRKGKMAVEMLNNPVVGGAKQVGFGIPNFLFGKILDFNFDAWGKATDALGQDPPRDDFTEVALPEPISLPAITAQEALSAEHAAALNALAAALAENLAIVRAARICEDRLGGALAAGDEEWAMTQAAALIGYKRQAGVNMMIISRRLDDVMAAVRNAGVADLIVTEEDVEAYQERLRDEGWNAEELQAAALLGISDDELAQMRAERLAADPVELAGSMLAYGDQLAEALWWLGKSWSRLPAAQP
ncbi:MAG: hypothetical protein AB7Y46_10165 [Armatimonadota bacterium]